MKRLFICAAALALVLPALAQEKAQLKDLNDKVSYAIGLNLGASFRKQGQTLSPQAVLAGMNDALAGKPPALSEQEMKDTMETWSKQMEDKQKVAGDNNVAEGKKFLDENKKKEGVKTTASGLQYKVLKQGNGAQPKESDTVTVNYRGTLVNGTEFDSSYKRGQPATFPVNGVIKGWTEALQLMKAGSKYQLFIPSDLAYGARAMGPDITPNSTLIFEVELMDVKPSAGAASPASSPR
jgi:FKBP-type peptidyl-prolyl cis-trans isomerase FklB